MKLAFEMYTSTLEVCSTFAHDDDDDDGLQVTSDERRRVCLGIK